MRFHKGTNLWGIARTPSRKTPFNLVPLEQWFWTFLSQCTPWSQCEVSHTHSHRWLGHRVTNNEKTFIKNSKKKFIFILFAPQNVWSVPPDMASYASWGPWTYGSELLPLRIIIIQIRARDISTRVYLCLPYQWHRVIYWSWLTQKTGSTPATIKSVYWGKSQPWWGSI